MGTSVLNSQIFQEWKATWKIYSTFPEAGVALDCVERWSKQKQPTRYCARVGCLTRKTGLFGQVVPSAEL